MRKIFGIILLILFIITFVSGLVFGLMNKGYNMSESISIIIVIFVAAGILVLWIYAIVILLFD